MSPKKVNFLYCEYCGWKKVCRDYSTIKSYEIEDDKYVICDNEDDNKDID